MLTVELDTENTAHGFPHLQAKPLAPADQGIHLVLLDLGLQKTSCTGPGICPVVLP